VVHPSADQLLDDDATAVAAHVAECEACRRLRELLRPASAAAASGDGELPGLRLVDPAHYALHEELRGGVGGMGRTVRATDRRLGRAVAIKQPLTDVEPTLAELLRARFEAEARLTARLEHPAIVTVYEAGRWPDGEPFYAMRLVRGAPLGRLIEQRRELADRIALVGEIVKVGEALAYAHARGVVHRDIKPTNVLAFARQRPGPPDVFKLADFGLAEVARTAHEEPEAISGTPRYMPPEQILGRWREQGPWTDLYALAVVAFETLTGTHPFAGFSLGFPAQRRPACKP
jgi:serine/threonine protein kinase